MSEPTTYQTTAGATVATGSRINAFNQLVHYFECDGCDGARGFKTADQADDGAQKHTGRCTDKPGSGGAR